MKTPGEKYPITAGIEIPHNAPPVPTLDWDFVDRLRDSTDMKLLIKGIKRRSSGNATRTYYWSATQRDNPDARTDVEWLCIHGG